MSEHHNNYWVEKSLFYKYTIIEASELESDSHLLHSTITKHVTIFYCEYKASSKSSFMVIASPSYHLIIIAPRKSLWLAFRLFENQIGLSLSEKLKINSIDRGPSFI